MRVRHALWPALVLVIVSGLVWMLRASRGLEDPERRPETVPGASTSERLEPAELAPGRRFAEAERAGVDPAPVTAAAELQSSVAQARVQMRFVDEIGRPSAGVRVRAGAPFDASALSDGDGELELVLGPWREELGAEASCAIDATLAGFAAERRTVLVRPGETTQLGEWMLRAGASVSGTVLGEDRVPVADAVVGLVDGSKPVSSWIGSGDVFGALALDVPRAQTLADGSYALDGVPAGRCRLVAGAAGRGHAFSEPLELAPGDLVFDVDLTLETAREDEISGIVLAPDDSPVPGARLELRSARSTRTAFGGEDGRFRFRGLDKPLYTLRARDPEGRFGDALLEGVAPGTTNLELRLPEAERFELVVRTEDGAAVTRFEAALVDVESGVPLAALPLEERAGGTAWVAVPAAAFRIEVDSPRLQPARAGPFEPAQVPARVELRLAAARGVAGRVLAGGRPVAGARVALHAAFERYAEINEVPARSDRAEERADVTREDGEFLLGVSERGVRFLRVTAEGFAPAEIGPLELTPDATRREDVHLGPGGTIDVVVRSSRGAGVDGHVVLATRGDGYPLTARTGKEGRAQFAGLTPGAWQVELRSEEPATDRFITVEDTGPPAAVAEVARVVHGETTRVELWVEDQGSFPHVIAGSLSIDGAGAAGWVASVEACEGSYAASGGLASDGTFRLGVPERGSYRLLVTPGAAQGAPGMAVLSTLAVSEPVTQWSLSFERARIAGDASEWLAGGGMIAWRWKGPGAECWCPLQPDAAQRFEAEVPAGAGQLVRVDPEQPLEGQTPKVLLTAELTAGETRELD